MSKSSDNKLIESFTALLPLKANSVRVKGKNFRNFHGKPLFKWMLDTLLEINQINHIVINTDAKEILKSHGLYSSDRIIIRERNPVICGDDVSMNLIIADDINNIASDNYLMTHTTNPLLSSFTIKKALDEFNIKKNNGDFDSLFSVDRIQKRLYYECGSPINHDLDNLVPTQDLSPIFIENSNLYIFTRDSFKKNNARIGNNPIMFETPFFESIDIDTESDWEFAYFVKNYLSNCENN